jgi:hypothetical protein
VAREAQGRARKIRVAANRVRSHTVIHYSGRPGNRAGPTPPLIAVSETLPHRIRLLVGCAPAPIMPNGIIEPHRVLWAPLRRTVGTPERHARRWPSLLPPTPPRRKVERPGSSRIHSRQATKSYPSWGEALAATVRRSRNTIQPPGLQALRYQALAELLSGCNRARAPWASIGPVPTSLPLTPPRGRRGFDRRRRQEGRIQQDHDPPCQRCRNRPRSSTLRVPRDRFEPLPFFGPSPSIRNDRVRLGPYHQATSQVRVGGNRGICRRSGCTRWATRTLSRTAITASASPVTRGWRRSRRR